MKFDVVVGNPPYNKGMDLDFVNMGFELCTKYCVMITPAKWQTAADDQRTASKTIDYKQFRKQLVPHMSKVVFYPDCKDLFDIYQIDGITYFRLDKLDVFDKTEVVNRSLSRDILNSVVSRGIRNRESLWNIGYNIVSHLGNYETFKFPVITNNRKYRVVANTQISGYDWFIDGQSRYVVGVAKIISIDDKIESNVHRVVFESDDIEECKSFVSWLYTKFTRFFVAINISKLGPILTDDYFRFVPAPPSGKFDHIYTDEELYKAFNLPQKYIDVIEAVIKERK